MTVAPSVLPCPPRRIGLAPRVAAAVDPALLSALGAAFDVVFEPADAPVSVDAWIATDADAEGTSESTAVVPTLIVPTAARPGIAPAGVIEFGDAVDPRLASRRMRDVTTPVVPLESARGELVLAACGRGAVWTMDTCGAAPRFRTAGGLPMLAPGAALKMLLTDGAFLGLLPLVDLLRRITGYDGWVRPEAVGAIVIDDPNLRAMRYGFVHYGDLAAVTEECDGHVVMATVPVDHRFVPSDVAELFRGTRHLSLAVHGNNHTKHELVRGMEDGRFALATAAQALRRSRALAQRAEVPISPIMVPPDEVTSRHVLAPLARVGFESICWMGPVDAGRDGALLGWDPADVHLAGGLPGIHRDVLDASLDEMVWRRYLDQSVIVHGHHDDLAEGPEIVAAITEQMRAAGVERFAALEPLSRSRLRWRRHGRTLEAQPYGRIIALPVEPGVTDVVIALPRRLSVTTRAVRVDNQILPVVEGRAGPFAVSGVRHVRVELIHTERLNPVTVAEPVPTPWPLARRVLTGARDRAEPLVRRPTRVVS